MRLAHRWVMAASLLIAAGSLTTAVADEPKHGGILKIYHRDNPPSASIHEEATYSTVIPFMPIFNNLVLYNQNVPQNSFDSIVPDLAESWSWSDDKTMLTFKLRHGVKWHDGKPFTANDVKFTIIPNRSTAILAFVAGRFDMTFPTEVTIPLLKDIKSQAPQAVCSLVPINVSTNLIVNRDKPPFDNADLRQAMALALDRKAFVDILSEGKDDIGASLLPPPEGVWGMPPDMLKTISGYGPDIQANRAQARKLMEKLGYGPNKRLPLKVSTRNIAVYRDPAVILIDQLKDIYIDGELEVVETSNWHSKVTRKDYAVGLNLTGNSVDDPDQNFYENYACGSERNYTQYCNKELEKLFDRQSMETDVEKRKKLVWEIDKRLQEDVARPIILHTRQGTCWQPYVKGVTMMINSSYNGYRFEDVWLDH